MCVFECKCICGEVFIVTLDFCFSFHYIFVASIFARRFQQDANIEIDVFSGCVCRGFETKKNHIFLK